MTAIDPHIRAEILDRLAAIERDEDVRILFAVESGSRAWGFPSTDSDYDVRFVYLRPRDWYLRLSPSRDVIEPPIDGLMDFAGWDVRKALLLALQSNAGLSEWLESPIIYRADAPAVARLRGVADALMRVDALRWHYLHLGERQWGNLGNQPEVAQKRYLYALRPALMLRHLRLHNRRPPMAIDGLLAEVDLAPSTRSAVEAFIIRKATAREMGTGPRIAAFDALIIEEMARARERVGTSAGHPAAEALALADRAFIDLLAAPSSARATHAD